MCWYSVYVLIFPHPWSGRTLLPSSRPALYYTLPDLSLSAVAHDELLTVREHFQEEKKTRCHPNNRRPHHRNAVSNKKGQWRSLPPCSIDTGRWGYRGAKSSKGNGNPCASTPHGTPGVLSFVTKEMEWKGRKKTTQPRESLSSLPRMPSENLVETPSSMTSMQ
jgi:hypothetical protein